MTPEAYKSEVKWLRLKTMREFAETHPEMTWADIAEVFARYDASRRYASDTEQ